MPPDDNLSNDVLDAAVRLQDFCREQGWRFCFIGGLAVQKWSEPRVTDDVDVTLFTGFGTEGPFIEALLGLDWVEPRIPRAREFALTRRVLLLQTTGGVGIDVALGAFAFEEEAIRRGTEITLLPGRALRLCTAEDLIVFKAFAARPQDWRDVEMTIVRQGDEALDWPYIHRQLRPLLQLRGEHLPPGGGLDRGRRATHPRPEQPAPAGRVGGRPAPRLRGEHERHRLESDASHPGRRLEPRGPAEDAIRRAERGFVARRPMDGLRLERNGPDRGLRTPVP